MVYRLRILFYLDRWYLGAPFQKNRPSAKPLLDLYYCTWSLLYSKLREELPDYTVNSLIDNEVFIPL